MEKVAEEILLHIFHYVQDEEGVRGVLSLRLVNHQWLDIAGDPSLGVETLLKEAQLMKDLQEKKVGLKWIEKGSLGFSKDTTISQCCWYRGYLIYISGGYLAVTSLPFPPTSEEKKEKPDKKVLVKYRLPKEVSIFRSMKVWEGEEMLVLNEGTVWAGRKFSLQSKYNIRLVDLRLLLDPTNWNSSDTEQELPIEWYGPGLGLGFVDWMEKEQLLFDNPVPCTIYGVINTLQRTKNEEGGKMWEVVSPFKWPEGWYTRNADVVISKKGNFVATIVTDLFKVLHVAVFDLATGRLDQSVALPEDIDLHAVFPLCSQDGQRLACMARPFKDYEREKEIMNVEQHKDWTLVKFPRQPSVVKDDLGKKESDQKMVSFSPWGGMKKSTKKFIQSGVVADYQGLIVMTQNTAKGIIPNKFLGTWKYKEKGSVVPECSFVTRKGESVATIKGKKGCVMMVQHIIPVDEFENSSEGQQGKEQRDEVLLIVHSDGTFEWVTLTA